MKALVVAAVVLYSSVAEAAPPTRLVRVAANQTKVVRGSIDRGAVIPLGWASTAAMACWPATRNQHFNGKHVLYRTRIPTRSIMTIELVPTDKNTDLSLYAYTGGRGLRPPRVRRAVSCEAGYLTGVKSIRVKGNPGGAERVRLNAVNNPYWVIIGVAGAHGTSRGSFELRITLKSGGPGVKDSGPPPVKPLAAKPNAITTVRGSIDGGKLVPLDWANTSQMACWPTTRNVHVNGHHVLYKTRLPRKSVMHIRLTPDPGKDLTLYAYSGSNPRLPPRVRRSVSCEASYLAGVRSYRVRTNPGKPERVRLNAINNPYDVIIGVAGAHGIKTGGFKLEVDLRTAAPAIPDTGPPPHRRVLSRSGKTVETRGSIDRGKRLPLGWANTGRMACWPTTKNVHANGNHVAYVTNIPARHDMTIELLPEAGKDLTLYAYTTRAFGRLRLPPRIRRALTCEASYLRGVTNRGVAANPGGAEKVLLKAVKRPQRVIIGVAGAGGLTRAGFRLRITTTPKR